MAVGLITCGEVEDVVGALTPVGRGIAQVFHDLLVVLRLLLVAEVEERKGRRTAGRRRGKKGGSQGGETTTMYGVCCVVQLSTSSLVFTLSCFSSRLLLYTLSS